MTVSIAKKVRFLAVLALMLVTCFTLLACQSAEDEVRAKADAELAETKNLSDESVAQVVEEMGTEETLEMFGISSSDFLKSCLEGFDYTIDEVTVDGDNATVKATLNHKSLEEAMMSWESEFSSIISEESAADMTEDEIYARAGEMLMEHIDGAPMTTSSVELPYVKSDGQWVLSPDAENVLSEVFAAGLL